ncbi:MAG: hypothetical protein QM820_36380 [Minicystis sp.]
MANEEERRIQHLLATLDRLLARGEGAREAPAGEGTRAVISETTMPAPVAAKWGARTVLGNGDDAPPPLRAPWSPGRIPQIAIEPASTRGAPRREGDYLLWSDPARNRVYFALAVPRLLDVSVLIRREGVGGTIQITGGSVTLTVSAYDRVGPKAVAALEGRWFEAILGEGPRAAPTRTAIHRPLGDGPDVDPLPPPGAVPPRYVPLVLRGLSASLDMDAALLAGPPVVSSSDAGTVTFVIALSALGAQAWMSALSGADGSAIGGVCRISARYYAHTGGADLTVMPIALSAPLGALLAGRGREIMMVLDAQTTAEGRVVVSGHPTLDQVTIDWRPSEGHRPEALIFGPDGGSFTGTITASDIDRVTIDWSAKVAYTPVSWPVITRRGQLSFARNDSILLLKPESWVTTYSLFVVLLDDAGRPIPEADHAGDTGNRVQCQVRFTAPFLAGGAAITEAFETTSQTLNEVAFPLPPGEPPGAVTLTVFAQLAGAAPIMKARALRPEETFLMVKVTLAGAIEVTANAPEDGSALGRLFNELASLRR